MPTSYESRIEDFAFDYLQRYYTSQQGAKNVVIGRAEKTRNGTEVDGLFAFKQTDNSLFLATVSFKNTDPIASLLIKYKKEGLSKLRFATPALLLVAGAYLSLQFGGGFMGLALAALSAGAGFILHTCLLQLLMRRNIKVLVNELKNHHANERWLGISMSSLIFRNNRLANYFLKLCQRRGIGLITVGKRAKVVLMQEPRTNICRKGDFLSHYLSDQNIRKAIQDDTILRVA